MNSVYINNVQSFLPFDPVNNDEIEDYLGYIGGKKSKAKKVVLRSNGIKSRYYVIEKGTEKLLMSNAQLTAKAIKKLENENFKTEDIECLSCGTTTPDQIMPNHTLMVQGELGLTSIETLSAAGICLSGINALKYGYYGIKCGELKNSVCTGSEIASAVLSAKNFKEESDYKAVEQNPGIAFEKDFLRWMLSDGAGAMLLTDQPNKDELSFKIEWIDVLSYAGEMPTCMYSGCEVNEDGGATGWRAYTQEEVQQKSIMAIAQDVKLLNENIIHYTVTKPMQEILEKRDLKEEEINYFLPHYSSTYFRDKVYEGMKKAGLEIPFEKWFTNLTTCGNTGSASIYIMLAELYASGKLVKGDKILCYIPESGRFSTSFMLLEVV